MKASTDIVLLDLHDATIETFIVTPGRVEILLSGVSAFCRTSAAETYDVRRCRVTARCDEVTRFETSCVAGKSYWVSEGELLVERRRVQSPTPGHWPSSYELRLVNTNAESMLVSGTGIALECADVGPVAETWIGPLVKESHEVPSWNRLWPLLVVLGAGFGSIALASLAHLPPVVVVFGSNGLALLASVAWWGLLLLRRAPSEAWQSHLEFNLRAGSWSGAGALLRLWFLFGFAVVFGSLASVR